MGADGMWESDWGLGAPVATSAKAAAADALLADTDADVGGRGIEVLLPDGEQELDAPSDADSEDFVRWMQSKVETEAAEPKAKVGGGRAARRRAAARRVEAGADAPPDAEPAPRAAATRGSRRRQPSAAAQRRRPRARARARRGPRARAARAIRFCYQISESSTCLNASRQDACWADLLDLSSLASGRARVPTEIQRHEKGAKRTNAQPGGVIRFTTCGERRKYKPAAAVHAAPAAARRAASRAPAVLLRRALVGVAAGVERVHPVADPLERGVVGARRHGGGTAAPA